MLASLALPAAGCTQEASYGGIDITEAPLSRTLRSEALIRKASSAVVVVETDVGRGMGFVIDPAGYVVTNRHVVEDADHIEGIVFPGRDPSRVYESVRIEYIDPYKDLALLHVHSEDPLPYLPLATRDVEPVSRYLADEDPVVLLQRGDDEARVNPGLVVRRGEINRLQVFNPAAGPGAFVGVTADVVPGQSGGPVLDAQGRAVGVVTWTWRNRSGSYAIPISEATRMLSERPNMDSSGEHEARVESRARTFLDALTRGDGELAKRLTSPSHARRVRGLSVAGIFGTDDESRDPAPMQWFVLAVEKLVVDPESDAEVEGAFAALGEIVSTTGSDGFRDALGVTGKVSADQVTSLFHEIGQAYLAARMFGDQEPPQAVASALKRLRTVDAARTFALSDALRLLGEQAAYEVVQVEVVPGAYAPTAVVILEQSAQAGAEPERHALHLRLEWGDWYVAEVRRAALSEAG